MQNKNLNQTIRCDASSSAAGEKIVTDRTF